MVAASYQPSHKSWGRGAPATEGHDVIFYIEPQKKEKRKKKSAVNSGLVRKVQISGDVSAAS